MVSSEEADENVCANCGIAGVDNIKLEECHGCDLVKYCSTNCREEHREQHSEECKNRKAELHDKRLFTQPDRNHRGECQLCFLPMPLDGDKSTFMSCCGQSICLGCAYANMESNKNDLVKASKCVFCRTPASDKEEYRKRTKERIEANHPPTLRFTGTECYRAGDYDKALKYLTKAAGLGDADAHFRLGKMYMEGEGVEKDEEKAVDHWEKAAIGGHPYARHNLACYAEYNGNVEIAVKHLIIAANLGFDVSMKALLLSYKSGFITKEEYGATLRAHQAAISATKSSQREVAERRWGRG
jgi:tetratricopeptide (TPR) repeat protein